MAQEANRPVGEMKAVGERSDGRVVVRTPSGQHFLMQKSTWTSFQGSGRRDGLAQQFDTEDLNRPYEQDDRVFAVVSLIADAFSDVPLRIYEKDPMLSDDVVDPVPDSDPLVALFNYWNPIYDASLAQTAIAQGLSLRGESFLFFTREGGGRLDIFGEGVNARIETPGEIWVVSGEYVQEEVDRTTGLIERWRVRSAQGFKEYDPETVISPRLLHPRNPYRGFGPMQAAFGASAQNYLAQRYRNALLRRGGDPGGLILIGEVLDPEDSRRLKQEIAQEFDDPDAGGATRLLEGGAKYQSLNLSPKELAYTESLGINADRIAAAFRVSKELLGQGDSNFGARLREETEAFWRMRVIPWLRLVERALNTRLFPMLADRKAQAYRARFDLSKVEALRGDLKSKVDLAAKLQQSGVPLNLAMQIARVDRAQEIEGGDVSIISGQWSPLSDVTVPIIESIEPVEAVEQPEAAEPEQPEPVEEPQVSASETALNGAQISSLLEMINQVTQGLLPLETAIQIIIAGFGFSDEQARAIMGDVKPGSLAPASDVAVQPQEAPAKSVRGLKAETFEEERDRVFSRWKPLANMTAGELKRWAQNECSRKASLDPAAVIKRNLDLLETPKSSWTQKQVRAANRAISFIERMRGVEEGKPASEGCPSKRVISLRNWAHNPGGRKLDCCGETREREVKSPPCRQAGESQDECVARKVPEILAESPDVSQDQAVAMAISMCSSTCDSSDEERTALERAADKDETSDFAVARQYVQKQVDALRPIEKQFTAKVRRVFDRMRRAQLKALSDYARTGRVSSGPFIEGYDSKAVASDEDVDGLMRKASFSKKELEKLIVSAEQKWADELAALLDPLYRATVSDALTSIASETGMTAIPMTDPKVMRILKDKSIKVAEGVNSTVAKQIKATLIKALTESQSTGSLQALIQADLEGLEELVRVKYRSARSRALAIARTEVAAANQQSRMAQIDAGVESGDVIGKRWLTGPGVPESAGGSRRDNHWRLDRKVVKPGETFDLGNGIRAQGPHDPSLPAGEVINCNCTIRGVVPD